MSTISALPDDQTYLKSKKSTSNLKLLVAGLLELVTVVRSVAAEENFGLARWAGTRNKIAPVVKALITGFQS